MKFNKIYIELSDICGLECSFCPITKGIRGIMNLDLFHKIVSECRQYTKLITFHILGDPLRLKNIKEYLNIAHKFNLFVEITTSGMYLDDFTCLLNAPIRQINISLDAIMEIKSKSLRDDALKKIFDFCKYKNSINSDIFLNLRIQNRIGPKSIELKNILKKEFNLVNLKKNTRIGKKNIIVFREPFLWNGDGEFNNKGFCYGLISHFGILANGAVVPCCIDANGDIVLGDLNIQSMEEILYSNRAKNMINGFKNGLIIEKKCLKCNYRMQFN